MPSWVDVVEGVDEILNDSVVLVDEGWGQWKVVTARDMTSTEKRLYKRTSGGS